MPSEELPAFLAYLIYKVIDTDLIEVSIFSGRHITSKLRPDGRKIMVFKWKESEYIIY